MAVPPTGNANLHQLGFCHTTDTPGILLLSKPTPEDDEPTPAKGECDGTDVEFLKSENIQNVDSFICVTENEKTNLIAGLLARHLGAKQSIIHVSTTEYIPTIQEIGAGAVISKNLSTVNAILRELHTDMTEIPVVTFDEIEVDVIEFQPESNSPVTQRPLKDLNLPKDCIVGMINHHGKIRIAHGTSILSEDDTALVFAKPKAVSKLKKLFMK